MQLRKVFLTMLMALSLMTFSPLNAFAGPPEPGEPPKCGSCGSGGTTPDWPPAPRACLPDRAERWETSEEMEPCHCPPQEMCPDNAALQPEDVTVIVTYNVNGHQGTEMIPGEEIPGLGGGVLQGTPLIVDNFINLINPVFQQRTGIDLLAPLQGTDRTDVTLAIDDAASLMDWINDTLDIPVELAITCCQNLCPDGFTPKIHQVEIEVPVTTGEGSGNPEDCESSQTYLSTCEVNLGAAQTVLAAAEAAKDAACNAPAGGPGAACDAATDAYNDAQDAYDDAMETLQNAQSQVATDCNIPDVVMEKKIVDVFTCHPIVVPRSREGCLIEGTKITLANGDTKPIEELKLGDEIKGNHGAAKIKALSRFIQEDEFMYSINDGQAFFTEEHPVLTKRGWKSVAPDVTSTAKSDTKIIGKLEVGDRILTKFGDLVVKKVEKKLIKGGTPAYNLSVDGDGSFIANGIIMKGFTQMQMHY